MLHLIYYKKHYFLKQITRLYNKEQEETAIKIQKEIIEWFVEKLQDNEITSFYNHAKKFNNELRMSDNIMNAVFYNIISKSQSL